MPCYDHRSSPSYIRDHEVAPLKQRCDQYARWLCFLLNDLDTPGLALPEDLAIWWREHEAFDADNQ